MRYLSKCFTGATCAATIALFSPSAAIGQDIPEFVRVAGAPERILAHVLEGPPDSARHAVADAFFFAGIAVVDEAGKRTAAAAPALPYRIRASELDALILDLRTRKQGEYRASIADIAKHLTEVGWKPQSSDDAGRALATVLIHAIVIAEREPGAETFVPLFLREVAHTMNPGVGLASLHLDPETIDPETIRFGDFELQLFLGMLLRSSTLLSAEAGGGLPELLPEPGFGAQGPAVRSAIRLPAATPCSDWLDEQPEAARPNTSFFLDASSGYLIDKAMNAAGETAGTVAGGISALFKLLRIMGTTMDKSITFELGSSVDTAQYRARGALGGGELSFTATAKLGPEADRWQHDPEIADCVKFLGFSIPDGREALLTAIGGFRVEWGVNTLGGHATFSRAKNPDFATHTRFTKPLSGVDGVWTSTFTVDMAEEKKELRPDAPIITHYGRIPMYAALDQSQPPDYSLLMKAVAAGAAFGGPAGSAVFTFVGLSLDVLEGMWQKLRPRKAYKPVVVSWNEPGPGGWYGTIELEYEFVSVEDTTYTTSDGGTTRNQLSNRRLEHALIKVVPESVERGSTVDLRHEQISESSKEQNGMEGCPSPTNNQQYVRTAFNSRENSRSAIRGKGNGTTHVAVGVREDGSYSIYIAGLPEFEQQVEHFERATHSGGCGPVPPRNKAGQGRAVGGFEGFVPLSFEAKGAPGARALTGERDALGWKVRWNLNWKGDGSPE